MTYFQLRTVSFTEGISFLLDFEYFDVPVASPSSTQRCFGRKRQQSKETVEGEQKSNQAKLDERLGFFLIWCEDLWFVVAAAGALSRFIVFVVSRIYWKQTSLQVQPWYFWESKWLLFRPIFLGLPQKIHNYKRESRWEPFRIKPSTPSLSWNHGENSMSWNQFNMCFQKGGTSGTTHCIWTLFVASKGRHIKHPSALGQWNWLQSLGTSEGDN